MNKIPRSSSWRFLLPAILFMTTVTGLAGCHSSGCEPIINDDSVKTHILPIGMATKYTAGFRAAIDSCSKAMPDFNQYMNFGHAEAFNSDVINLLLKQKNSKGEPAVGIRIYYGRDEKGLIRMILVPYDSHNNDIINHMINLAPTGAGTAHTEALKVAGDDGQTVEEGQHCPTICDDGGSGLNGGQ